jgi:hypothetical protein
MNPGDVITLAGVFVAVVTIFTAYMSTLRQRDLDALMQLSKHLTTWHDDVVDILHSSADPTKLDPHKRIWKYFGPFLIIIARFDARKRYMLFGGWKYEKVIEASKQFAYFEFTAKNLDQGDYLNNWDKAYTEAMLAISKQVGTNKQSKQLYKWLYLKA